MNETLAFYATKTVPGFPLGQPHDGRPRYGMTPSQAAVYRWLVRNKPHDGHFKPNCRECAAATGIALNWVHKALTELCDRGWLDAILCASGSRASNYAFVHPVMTLRGSRRG